MRRLAADPDLEALLDQFEAWIFTSFRMLKHKRRHVRLEIVRLLRDLGRPLTRPQALAVSKEDVVRHIEQASSPMMAYDRSLNIYRFFSFCLKEGLVQEKLIDGPIAVPYKRRAASLATLGPTDLTAVFSAASNIEPRHHGLRNAATLRLLYAEELLPSEVAAFRVGDLVGDGIKLRRANDGILALSSETKSAIVTYLAARHDIDQTSPLILGRGKAGLSASGIGLMMRKVGQLAGVHLTIQLLRETSRLAALDRGEGPAEIQARARLTLPPVMGRHQGKIDFEDLVRQFRLVHPRYDRGAG